MWNHIIDTILISNELLVRFIISMLLSIALGLVIALIYRYTHRGLNYESSFLATLVILAPIVTLVMFFIQGDLVLSLGLVGSLSIIRFRTPIKDTRDMVYLFWVIALGLGMGTHNWILGMVATVIIGILVTVFYLIRYGRILHVEYILVITGKKTFDDHELKAMSDTIKIQVRSVETEDDRFENVYELRFDKAHLDEVNAMIARIRELENTEKVSLLSPQLALPM